jgi:hypothetical protein
MTTPALSISDIERERESEIPGIIMIESPQRDTAELIGKPSHAVRVDDV